MTTRTLGLAPWLCVLLLGVTALGGCGDSAGDTGTDPDPGGEEPAEVNDYVAGLGSWEEFAPPQESKNEPDPEGSTAIVEETVEEEVNGVVQQVTYQCTETPYDLTSTPSEIVMYEPNASVMWVGNLIEGDSYKGGQGSFEELSIRQRDTLFLSIDLLTGGNFAAVPNPSLTSVQSAIGELIQDATDAGHRSGSSIDYEERLTYSVEQAALQLGLSARYLGGKAKADLNVSRAANERTLVAHFVQKMFTISIELPQQPSDMFSDELTQEIWDQHVGAGEVGPNNLPVYIAQITYGRTLTYSLTSTHSEKRMRAAISASYNGLAGGGSGYTEAELQETLGEQNIRVTAIGGEGQNVLNLISSGDLKAYFTEDAPLTSARPISYQLNFLGDNSIAKVSETTDYTLRECEPKPASGGRFEFLPLQSSAAPVPVPYRTHSGDFDGDGREDLAWSHLSSGSNEMAVGFARADGTFDIRAAYTYPESPSEGWANGYVAHVGDFNGDGNDDIAFNRGRNTTRNITYVAFSNADGTFTPGERNERPGNNWGEWDTLVGDLNGDDISDLVWNLRTASENAVWVSLGTEDGTFDHGGRLSLGLSAWAGYDVAIGDATGEGWDDLIFNARETVNRSYTAVSNGDGTLTLSAPSDINNPGFGPYTWFQGDVNRADGVDLFWIDLSVDRDPTPIHRSMSLGDGRFTWSGLQEQPRPEGAGELRGHVGDFNGDGGADILMNELEVGTNHVWIGLGNEAGGFNFTPLDQEHPASASSEDWTAFAGGVLVMDVDGDGLDDVVWNERSASNRIYVALAKPVGS